MSVVVPSDLFGLDGCGPGNFVSCKDVAIDSRGHNHLADAILNHVQVLDRRGQLALATEGCDLGEFYLPGGMAIGSRDRILFLGAGNTRLQAMQFRRR